MKEGSFWPVSFTTRSAAHTATKVIATGAESRVQGMGDEAVQWNLLTSSSQASSPESVPQVPGAGLR